MQWNTHMTVPIAVLTVAISQHRFLAMGRKRRTSSMPFREDDNAKRKAASMSSSGAKGRMRATKGTKLDGKTSSSTAIISPDHKIRPPQQQQHEEGEEEEESEFALGGIPWALIPESDRVSWAEDENVHKNGKVEQVNKEDDEDQLQDAEKDVRHEGDKTADKRSQQDQGSSTSASFTSSGPHSRWKQHPDRLKSTNNPVRESKSDEAKRGRGKRKSGQRESGAETGKSAAGKVDAGGMGDEIVGEERRRESVPATRRSKQSKNADGSRGRLHDESVLLVDEDSECTDGHYGPRVEAPPCTVFVSREGKVQRVGGSSPALVVGLDQHEQLGFVGAARVRCGRGRAEMSGYTLRPVPWGPYFEAHSPRWMGLLTVRALGTSEWSGGGTSGTASGAFGVVGFHGGSGGEKEGGDLCSESDIEDAVDRVAKNFPVVVVLRSVPDGPLNFLSAQADADALYSPKSDTATTKTTPHPPKFPTPSAEENEGEEQGAMMRESNRSPANDRCGASDVTNDMPPALKLAVQLRLPGLQVVTTEVAGLAPFTVSREWSEAVDAILASPQSAPAIGLVLVCGAKGVGKSTMSRLLVNRMLSQHPKVAYMDCDLGQPEFTAPGQVSLHILDSPILGPPHSNIRRPQISYFIGSSTPKPELVLFSAAVRALAEHTLHLQQQAASFAAEGPPPPIVVNTDGWVKGMGADLLGAVIDAVQPRHIVQILGSSASRIFQLDRLPDRCEVHRVDAWKPPAAPVGDPPAPPRPSARELRDLRMVAYFVGQDHGDDLKKSGKLAVAIQNGCAGRIEKELSEDTKSTWDGGDGLVSVTLQGGTVYDQRHEIAALLASRRPRRIPWKAIQVRVMNGAVTPGLIQHSINGALVGLVAMPRQHRETGDEDGIGEGKDAGDSIEPAIGAGLMSLAETPLAPCVGLGIVRSVDVQKRVLYVLTPEPLGVLKQVNLLVKGSIQLPMVMLYDPRWCSHPYFSSETLGGDVIKARKLLRKGYEHVKIT